MKATYLLAAVVSFAFVLSSCRKAVKPSDEITIETRQFSGYDKIDVSDDMEVEVTIGTQEQVIVEANENLHQYILIDVVNGTLKIRIKNNIRVRNGAQIKIYVTALSMESVIIDGSSRVEFLSPVTSGDFNLNVSGASTFQGGITTGDLDLELKGASRAEIWGTATNAKMKASGASNIGDFALTITDYLNIDLSGASKAELTAEGTMDIEVSGASRFNYMGDGVINELDISGGSSVNKQ